MTDGILRGESNEAWTVQVSPRLPDGTLINIRATSLEELDGQLDILAAEDGALIAKIVETATGFGAAYNVSAGVQATPPAGNVPAASTPTAGPASSAAPQSQGGGGGRVVTDRWGNQFVYDAPGAPITPRGSAVMKMGTSKAGKPYKRWVDPASGPEWYPKPKPADLWDGEFVNDR